MGYVLLLTLLTAHVTYGVTSCPPHIQYKNGQFLKQGDRYYYPEGSFLLNGLRVYYPNGQYLKNGERYYYSNGSYLQNAESLYYPNGQTLKRQDRYYYSNGVILKSGETVYYQNGAYARRNGQLYRPNGTLTAYPIRIAFPIGTVGEILADIHPKTDSIEISFDGDFVHTPQVSITSPWHNDKFKEMRIIVRTGVPYEWILLRHNESQTQCELIPPPSKRDDFFRALNR